MTYERFEEYITKIVNLIQFQDSLDRVTREWNRTYNKSYPTDIYIPTLIPETIALLEEIMHDKDEWISYWVYELDCGRKWVKDTITSKGIDVPLKTIRDLWEILSET